MSIEYREVKHVKNEIYNNIIKSSTIEKEYLFRKIKEEFMFINEETIQAILDHMVLNNVLIYLDGEGSTGWYTKSNFHLINPITVKNDRRVSFTVRLVRKGQKYGKDFCLVYNEDKPMIEFYDQRYIPAFTGFGQFVSRYYVSTFMDIKDGGLSLDSDIDNWTLTEDNVKSIQESIKNIV